MGVYHETIPPSLIPWIQKQPLLLIGTAPLSPNAHINISPKGGSNFFGVLSPTQFWYLDLTGSGVETYAHLHEPGNGRICIMFMSFEGAPQIVRIWGTGTVLENGTTEYADFVAQHNIDTIPGSRAVVVVDVHQCGTSCGFSVPRFEFVGHREVLNDFFRKKEEKYKSGEEGESMDRYWAWKSARSVDGLPGMKRGVEFAERHGVQPLRKWKGEYAPGGAKAWGSEQKGGSKSISSSNRGLLGLVWLLGIVIGALLGAKWLPCTHSLPGGI